MRFLQKVDDGTVRQQNRLSGPITADGEQFERASVAVGFDEAAEAAANGHEKIGTRIGTGREGRGRF